MFVAKACVFMDKNPVKRALLRPVVSRKLSYGSQSESGAIVRGVSLVVFATVDIAGIDLRRWLENFLRKCTAIGPAAVVADPPTSAPRASTPRSILRLEPERSTSATWE